ncbi:lysophospholipid acyltransferase family protein [Curvibacter sp. APW13]|uniref:lysophospholipid acyltransferase family protein n=1 Tax=Curvibacter sp. APW13 TaxID=3077236 RepID=UPI0028DDC7A2|nr:lysophospholipid acyltransferase family protein [Curvibacter sp. APW13]MDT8989599.1 lysophospholipid acyltransferase family protein [Curvibacter sp. APW13]
MQALFRFLALVPLSLLHGLGSVLGLLAYLFSPDYRQRFRDNVAQAGLQAQVGWRAVFAAGRMVSELPRIWFGAPVPVQWQGAEHIEAALAAGRGIVFLTPHLGCFEITAQAYAQRYGAKRPITVLYRPARKAWLRPLVDHARHRPGLETAPTTLAGVKQLIKALRAGGCVGLLPDQVPPAGMGVWVPFFGRDAYTMTLAARLALQTGAVVLLGWGERLPWGRGYTVHVQPLRHDLEADLTRATTQVNEAMEALVRLAPAQYLWGYARYKAPKTAPEGIA